MSDYQVWKKAWTEYHTRNQGLLYIIIIAKSDLVWDGRTYRGAAMIHNACYQVKFTSSF
jgi:hypothetical protein